MKLTQKKKKVWIDLMLSLHEVHLTFAVQSSNTPQKQTKLYVLPLHFEDVYYYGCWLLTEQGLILKFIM